MNQFDHRCGPFVPKKLVLMWLVGLDEEADGGAIYVGGNLTVIGNLSIHNCSAEYGGSLGLKYL